MCPIATARSGQTAGNFRLSDNPQMNAVLGANLPPFGFFGKAEPPPSRIDKVLFMGPDCVGPKAVSFSGIWTQFS